ncbi:hypothetical protein CLHOM_04470 [Clostridium homopropionicum DSM 5847]|uniref:Uncharacterized protein n=1 Tax=Clostridium homopropionicum DSM 5847 TaxID=1121318 RepID=A0A0L6ZD04_9CLOT|nr:DNA-processing protein DprA [Clostridium homopropionicum]KOA20859.1 hypothetical protein CLHOM_04470 [Clostridium homopropionicum DSM 5847]SFG03505.1 DNA processing protein [Clostridium homopropionicum]
MNEYEIWFAISKLPYSIKNNLVKQFGNVARIWHHTISYEKHSLINDKIILALKEAWDMELIKYISKKILSEGINTVVITDEMYPNRLKEYDDSPYMLFYKGDITKLNDPYNISIVGSRTCTSYGINVTNIICEHMNNNKVNIISGMARGIDSIAHENCIKNNSYTCAVLGSGIDVVYPKENYSLYKNIIKNGCVISQFLPGTKPYAYNFPIRNKIISALGDVLIVVEANDKSGSLITATYAIEQGKEVLAVPGNIFSSQSKGTNKLIKEGANIFTNIEQIFDILHIKNNIQETKFSKSMKPLEKTVYEKIDNTPLHFDDILRATKIDIKQLYEVLFELQLKDEIMCISGNYFVKNNKKV